MDDNLDIRKIILQKMEDSESPIPISEILKERIIKICVQQQYSTHRTEFEKQISKTINNIVAEYMLKE